MFIMRPRETSAVHEISYQQVLKLHFFELLHRDSRFAGVRSAHTAVGGAPVFCVVFDMSKKAPSVRSSSLLLGNHQKETRTQQDLPRSLYCGRKWRRRSAERLGPRI